MKKLTSLLLTALIATTLTAGCGSANTTTSTDTQTASSAEETVQENQEKETKEKFVIVDDNLSNLQLTAPNLPVYDKMTIAQRREKGLPTALPELTPYSTGIAILDTLKENNAVANFVNISYKNENTRLTVFPRTIKQVSREVSVLESISKM